MDRVFQEPVDIAQMFRDEGDLRDFFNYLLSNCVQYAKDNPKSYYPFTYDNERGNFNVSYDFFIKCVAKAFEPDDKETTEKIFSIFSLKATRNIDDYKEKAKLNRAKAFLILGLLQDYFQIVYPNNKKISSGFKGKIQQKDTYYLVNVYEDKNGNAIEYEGIPFKKENLRNINVDEDLINLTIDYANKKGLKQVAFNPANAKKYWEQNRDKQRLLFE
jgi:hypothetical protein